MDNMLVVVILVALVTAAVMAIGFKILEQRKKGLQESILDSFFAAWPEIRPILTELFLDLSDLFDVSQTDYGGLEEYAVNWLHERIQKSDALLPEEKALLNKDRLRRFLRPRLKEWYDQKLKE